VTFTADFAEKRSRLSTFFRLILVIPHLIVVCLYGIGAFFAIVGAWFVLVFTGRWPQGLYDFTAGFFRWNTRVNGYLFLATDQYPPFDGGEHPEYPVRLAIGPPKEAYGRLRALGRIIMIIPVYIAAYILGIVAQLVAIISWFVIVIAGRQVEGLHSALAFAVGYEMKAYAFMGLVFEEWPSFSDEPALEAPERPETPERP
jgi:uncharacterized membrane protein